MRNLLKLCLVLGTLVLCSAHGTFKSYNNEERKKFKGGNPSLNEVTSADFHWSGAGKLKGKCNTHYDPTWESLDARPLPAWYDKAKVGIFIHWGLYSVPGVASEWFWKQWTDGNKETRNFMEKNYKPGTTYQDFAPEFTAQFYNPEAWADLFKKAGAKYIVLTSKHHEGYTLWPSRYSFSWNAKDIGPHRDVLGDLANAIRNRTDIKFGLYHSLYEWYNPLWMNDKNNDLKTDEFVRFKTLPELYELVELFKPEVVWSDGEWEASDTYWQSKEFLAWLYNESPVKDTVVTNDRWGGDTLCKHGGYYTCADRYNPGVLQPHKWENCFTLDKESWGHRRNANISEFLTPEDLITTIVESVACNGNVLVNVGPNKDGMIEPIQEERLVQMGEWLDVNGEAIYNTVYWKAQNDTHTPGVWFTTNEEEGKVYAMMTRWPGSSVTLGSVTPAESTLVTMLGFEGELEWRSTTTGTQIDIPRKDEVNSKWAWTLVFTNLQ